MRFRVVNIFRTRFRKVAKSQDFFGRWLAVLPRVVTRGQRLRLLRTARGLDLGVLAERAGYTSSALANIEHDRFGGRAPTLDAIAGALKVERKALDDDAECVRELCRIVGVPLPNAGPSLEGEAAAILASTTPEVRAVLVAQMKTTLALLATMK
jgi:transcriptional regulator with XRE-family HTH domain